MKFFATKTRVSNRGIAPDSFLSELVAWLRSATDDIFARNPAKDDIYAYIAPTLGPWVDLTHRRAALGEEMRVHAGFESSWKFGTGVDTTNHTSMTHKSGQETGIFQVSFDSLELGHGTMKPFAEANGILNIDSFINRMKTDHMLAFEYYARLIRVNVQWAGPIKRHEIDQWLSRESVEEIKSFLVI